MAHAPLRYRFSTWIWNPFENGLWTSELLNTGNTSFDCSSSTHSPCHRRQWNTLSLQTKWKFIYYISIKRDETVSESVLAFWRYNSQTLMTICRDKWHICFGQMKLLYVSTGTRKTFFTWISRSASFSLSHFWIACFKSFRVVWFFSFFLFTFSRIVFDFSFFFVVLESLAICVLPICYIQCTSSV